MAENANTTIQVSRQARDHLAQVAKERGVTLGQLVEQLASQQLTADQIAERVAATRKVLRERMGCTLTDEEFDQGPDVLANVYAMAAEKMHGLRGKAA
jgi:predicted DNA-binding ribbon-helix-helix protein